MMIKKTIIICLLFLAVNSCKKEEFNIENLNGNKITCLGHGGMGVANTYPMDSYESISKCLSIGMDGSEFDVQMTNDSVLVLFHDQELSDCTNLNGIINSMNWNELQNAHYTQTPYLNYSIISLEQLFAKLSNIHKYTFTFDCKLYTEKNSSQFYVSYINALIKLLQKYQLENNVLIESQSEDFLALLKNSKPDYKLFIYPASFDDGLNTALSLNLFGITISTRDITKVQIEIAHKNKLKVAVWNTHSASDNKEAIKKNPDYIQTDKLENLINLLK